MTNWKLVEGFEDKYRVSDDGHVSSIHTGKILKPAKVGAGYLRVCLFVDGKGKNKYIHRLVAETFLGASNGREINHRNGNKQDNRLQNLEWSNRSENVLHSYYELGQKVKSIYAIKTDLTEILEFDSIERAVQSGFSSPRIYDCLRGDRNEYKGWRFIYKTTPQTKEWVSLTNEQIVDLVIKNAGFPTKLAKAIETKLKEKNAF